MQIVSHKSICGSFIKRPRLQHRPDVSLRSGRRTSHAAVSFTQQIVAVNFLRYICVHKKLEEKKSENVTEHGEQTDEPSLITVITMSVSRAEAGSLYTAAEDTAATCP